MLTHSEMQKNMAERVLGAGNDQEFVSGHTRCGRPLRHPTGDSRRRLGEKSRGEQRGLTWRQKSGVIIK